MPEKEKPTLTRFKREKLRHPYRVPRGAFESALMVVKRVFDDETLGVSDTTFWHNIERKVTMKPKTACFQYYLAGKGHISLAEMLLDHFSNFKSARLSGDMNPDEVEEKVNRLADKLLLLYPPDYQRMYERVRVNGKENVAS